VEAETTNESLPNAVERVAAGDSSAGAAVDATTRIEASKTSSVPVAVVCPSGGVDTGASASASASASVSESASVSVSEKVSANVNTNTVDGLPKLDATVGYQTAAVLPNSPSIKGFKFAPAKDMPLHTNLLWVNVRDNFYHILKTGTIEREFTLYSAFRYPSKLVTNEFNFFNCTAIASFFAPSESSPLVIGKSTDTHSGGASSASDASAFHANGIFYDSRSGKVWYSGEADTAFDLNPSFVQPIIECRGSYSYVPTRGKNERPSQRPDVREDVLLSDSCIMSSNVQMIRTGPTHGYGYGSSHGNGHGNGAIIDMVPECVGVGVGVARKPSCPMSEFWRLIVIAVVAICVISIVLSLIMFPTPKHAATAVPDSKSSRFRSGNLYRGSDNANLLRQLGSQICIVGGV
jgi:hypothetical protein